MVPTTSMSPFLTMPDYRPNGCRGKLKLNRFGCHPVPLSLGTALWLPVILLPVLFAALGAALVLSALGVFWRDIGQVTQFVTLALLFASAVFYPVNQIPAPVWAWLKFNPLLLAIEAARGAVFWGTPANLTHLTYLYAVGLLLCVVGATLFQRLRHSFADVL